VQSVVAQFEQFPDMLKNDICGDPHLTRIGLWRKPGMQWSRTISMLFATMAVEQTKPQSDQCPRNNFSSHTDKSILFEYTGG
jgi:hypothetical protein